MSSLKLSLFVSSLIALGACDGQSVVGGDASRSADITVSDVFDAAIDTPDTTDIPDITVSDVFDAAIDTPDIPDTTVGDAGPSRCTVSNDCVGNPGGPVCDFTSGRCVACTTTEDNCPTGQYCVAGTLTCTHGCSDERDCLAVALPDGGTSAPQRCDTTSHTCVACIDDTHCAPGSVCVGHTCVAGCSASHTCPTGQTCCDGACVDPQSNSAHCGACGTSCTLPPTVRIVVAHLRCVDGATETL